MILLDCFFGWTYMLSPWVWVPALALATVLVTCILMMCFMMNFAERGPKREKR